MSFEERAGRSQLILDDSAFAEISHVSGSGLLDKIHGELKQADLPCIINALNNGIQRLLGKLGGALDAFQGFLHGTLQNIFHELEFCETETRT